MNVIVWAGVDGEKLQPVAEFRRTDDAVAFAEQYQSRNRAERAYAVCPTLGLAVPEGTGFRFVPGYVAAHLAHRGVS